MYHVSPCMLFDNSEVYDSLHVNANNMIEFDGEEHRRLFIPHSKQNHAYTPRHALILWDHCIV